MMCRPAVFACLVGLGLAAAGVASAGSVRAEPRREVLDRHGHVIGHLPPLQRDGACAPDLFGLLRLSQGTVASRIDGRLQVAALAAVQRGVLRLARDGDDGEGAAMVTEVDDERALLMVAGQRVALPLPLAPRCAGHDAAPQGLRPRVGERLRVQVVQGEAVLQPQAALVAIDLGSRDVLALVGGYHQRPGDFNRAVQGRRQAGSTWKPLVFAAALAAGRSPDEVVWDLPRVYGGWRPRNFDGKHLGLVTLRRALALSINTVAVELLAQVGLPAVLDLSERLGIPRRQSPRDLTLALGTVLVSPLQLGGAYAALLDEEGARYLPPRLLDGDPTLVTAGGPVLPLPTVRALRDLLGEVVRDGSARAALSLGRLGLRGKTGTTSQGNDAWFVGESDGLLAVVWVGDDQPQPSSRSGAESALPIWIDFIARAAPLAAAPRPAPADEVATKRKPGYPQEE